MVDFDSALEFYSDDLLQIISNELNLPDIKLDGIDNDNSRKILKESLKAYLLTNPQALQLFLKKDQSSRFINSFGYTFIKDRKSSFSLIVDRFHHAHKESIKRKLLGKIDPNAQQALEDNLHLILAQAALDGVDPNDYIRSLTYEELQAYFNYYNKDLDEKDLNEYLENLRSLMIEYMEASIKAGHLEEFTKSKGEFDQQQKRVIF